MKAVSFLAALLVTGSAFGHDFRGHLWGDDMLSVIGTHGQPALRSPGLLVYERRIGGEDALVHFAFGDHGLAEGGYLLHREAQQATETLRSFETMNTLLEHRYGGGRAEHQRLRAVMSEASEEQRALAVANGELLLLNRWRTGGSEFSHVLRGQHLALDHGFVFRSPTGV